MSPVLFWILFTLACVWIQRFVPGIDFLAPGLVVCFQQLRPRLGLWLALAWILIQEGTGSLAFGAGILWYAGLAVLYLSGRWLFESRNLLFMFLVGVGLGAWHLGLSHMMAALQDLDVDRTRLLLESLVQAALFPIQWALVSTLYRRWTPDDRKL